MSAETPGEGRDPLEGAGEAFQLILGPDETPLFICTEWCRLLRSWFLTDFVEIE